MWTFLLVTGVTPLSTNNFNQTFSVTVDQSHTLAWSNCGSFLLTNCFNSVMLVGLFAWTALFRLFQHIYIGLRSGVGQKVNFFCFNHSLVDWLLCLGSLSCLMSHFLLGFNLWMDMDNLLVRYKIHSSVNDCKPSWSQGSKASPSILPQHFLYKPKIILFNFYSKIIIYSGLICPQNILPMAFWLIYVD